MSWHQIGNINILLCKCSSRIGIGLTLNWQIGLGLTKSGDRHWIGVRFMNWLTGGGLTYYPRIDIGMTDWS